MKKEMNKQAKGNAGLIILILIVVAAIAFYFYYHSIASNQKTLMGLIMYDKSGNIINQDMFSIVNNVPNVASISIAVRPCNLDNVSLTFNQPTLTSSSNLFSSSSFSPSGSYAIAPGSCINYISSQADVSNLVGNYQVCANVTSQATNNRNAGNKNGCINISISSDNNPTNPNYNVSIITNTGNQGCTESWTCGSWSSCSSSAQTRTCTDSNSCGTTISKPATSQSCSTSGFTKTSCGNAGNLNDYVMSGCKITLDVNNDGVLETKTYNGGGTTQITSSQPCSYYGQVQLSTTTSEGFTLRYNTNSGQVFICSSTQMTIFY